jgi:hypothetical protein
LIDNRIIDPPLGITNYFFRAYETYLMLSNSSQVDGNTDFQNADIRRVQGFSQNLMYKLLQLNSEVSAITATLTKLKTVVPATILQPGSDYLTLTRTELARATSVLSGAKNIVQQIQEKMTI